MHITYGATRFVLLTGNKAIKIARFRPIRLMFRVMVLPLSSKRNRDRFYEKYGTGLLTAIRNYLFVGLVANRIEYEYYKKHRDLRVMPTQKQFLRGLITVQDRGTRVSNIELSEEYPFTSLDPSTLCPEMLKAVQFCRNSQGRIVMVDYGMSSTIRALEASIAK
jgi:hypothetical protein